MLEEINRSEEKSKENAGLILKLRENPFVVSTIVLSLALIILLFLAIKSSFTGKIISGDEAGKKLVNFLNERVGGGVSLVSSKDIGNIYECKVKYKGEEIPVYVTKDGNYFVQGVTPLTGKVVGESDEGKELPPQQQEIKKSDKPKVELFVMTYCPFGLQAEKGLLPVLKLLGNKIEGKISFVHYFMHGEKEQDETYTQLCIREEQSSKFFNYLECFIEDGNSERCLSKLEIDKTKLNSCMQEKAKEYYAEESELSKDYGVQGSPTLIINGIELQVVEVPLHF